MCIRDSNKGIEQYVHSVHIQLATVIGLHILVLGYFYPFAVITSIFVPATYFILYKWIELIYIIEQANRDNLIMLIKSTEYEPTRKILLQELHYADMHSLGGDPVVEIRI